MDMPKITQISTSGVENTKNTQCNHIITALCEDGSIWTAGDFNSFQLFHSAPKKSAFDSDRAKILLKAVKEIMDRQKEVSYLLDIFNELVDYDGTECDGGCLHEDIKNLLEECE